MITGLGAFLSEESLNLHREHLRKMKLKYSVYEKGMPEMVSKGMREIMRMRIKEREDILNLMRDIKAHELYFDSFGAEYQTSSAVRNKYGSEATFFYELYETAKKAKGSFLLVTANRGGVGYEIMSENSFLKSEPIFAIDLCEHSYLFDFGFEKEEYLKKAISRLNLNRIDKIFSKRD